MKQRRGPLESRTELDTLRHRLARTERALESLSRLLALIPDPIEIVAPAYTHQLAHPAPRPLHDNPELEGTLYYESVMGLEEPPEENPVLRAIDDDREATYSAAGGAGETYDIAVTPIVLSDGRRAAMCYTRSKKPEPEVEAATAEDREVLQRIAEKSAATLDAVLAQVSDAVVLLDHRGDPVLFNRAFATLTGQAGIDTATGETMAGILFPDRPGVDVSDLVRPGGTERFETRIAGPDGEDVPVEMAASRIAGETDTDSMVLVSFRDLRETQEVKDQLVKALNLSLAGERIASLAHQVNNYLTPAFYHAEKLGQRKNLDNKTVQSVTTIQNYLNLCHESIVMVLSLIRPAVPTEINMNHVISEVFSKHYLAEDLRLDNIEVVQRYDPSMVHTVGYPVLLQQAIANIIKNAQEAMVQANGGGRLMVFTESTPSTITIRITDNGPGIPEDIKGRIFDLLFTSKPSGKSSGVGLHFTREVIAKHDGRIAVKSKPGSGATFVIELPVRRSAGDRTAAESTPHDTVDPGADVAVENLTGRILIIDDEPGILELLSDILAGRDHEVTKCADAGEAYATIRQNRFDCIICDVRMPDLDGLELSRRIKEFNREMYDGFVLITGDIFNDETGAYVRETGIPCIEKPFTPDQVHDVVQGVLAKTRAPENEPGDG